MKYIIMCGARDNSRHLVNVKGEVLVARTIRQLKSAGVTDIAISTTSSTFRKFGVPLLVHDNRYAYGISGYWVDAFYPVDEPVCYIFGDVVFTDEAIKKIVETETSDIEFFASVPPFAEGYPKRWAEPFAFKVVDYEYFQQCVEKTKRLRDEGMFMRESIAWELWQVIKGTTLNNIIYKNYIAINDSTCDVDCPSEVEQWQDI